MHITKVVRNDTVPNGTGAKGAVSSGTGALAQAALRASSVYDLRALRVEQRNGTLVIFGSVSTFYHKQLAQEIILGISRELDVINEIHVLYQPR